MKKFIALALSAVLALSAFTACGGSDKKDKVETPAYDVVKVAETVKEAANMTNPLEIDDEYMSFIGMDSELYEKYSGVYCTPGVDIILAVQAKDGKIEDVKEVLTKRRDEVYHTNENYGGVVTEKAKEGRVVVKGNFAVLAIAGDDAVIESEGAAKAYEPIDKAIDEAFK